MEHHYLVENTIANFSLSFFSFSCRRRGQAVGLMTRAWWHCPPFTQQETMFGDLIFSVHTQASIKLNNSANFNSSSFAG